jgi:protein-disulfide isomerase
MGTGLTPHATALPRAADPLSQGTSKATKNTQLVNTLSVLPTRGPEAQPVIGPPTRVFYFFAPQCPYCAQETPLVNELLRGRTDVVGIAMDTTPEALMPHVQTMRFPFPVMLDRGESRGFGVTGYPTVVVRDDTGAARKLTGLATKAQLQQVLQGILP